MCTGRGWRIHFHASINTKLINNNNNNNKQLTSPTHTPLYYHWSPFATIVPFQSSPLHLAEMRTIRQPSTATTTPFILPDAPIKQERVKGLCYMYKGSKKCWNGTRFTDACAHLECSKRPTFNVEGGVLQDARKRGYGGHQARTVRFE